MSVKSCLLCGVGGQGTVLASKLIAFAAMERGQNVRTAETIEMAQRGGCVVSHVRIGDTIHSPMIPKHKADIIVAFEPGEAVRCLDYLKEDGTVIVAQKEVKPISAMLSKAEYDGKEMLEYLKKRVKNVKVIDTDEICEKCGSHKIMNIALLGAACKSGELGISVDELKKAVVKRIPERFHKVNLAAIDLA